MVYFRTNPFNFGMFWKALESIIFRILYDHFVYILCGHLLYLVAICCILWSFVILSPILVHFTTKNLATLHLLYRKLPFFAVLVSTTDDRVRRSGRRAEGEGAAGVDFTNEVTIEIYRQPNITIVNKNILRTT
jgi:hypothetical protein